MSGGIYPAAFYLRPSGLLKAKLFCYARRRNSRTRARGRARRQVAKHSGGRVCPRVNGTHSGRRTRRPFARAGDRHWSVEGAAGGSKVTASKTRQAANKTPGKARSRKGPRWSSQKAFSKTFPRDETRAQAREPSVSIEAGIVETREAGGKATLCTIAFGRCKKGRQDSEASPLRRMTTRG